jgi:hypothetical protein
MVRYAAIAVCLSTAALAQEKAAQQPATPAPAETPAAAPAPAPTPAAAPAPAAAPETPPPAKPAEATASNEGKMHLDAVVAFLRAWGKGRWEDARAVAADKVTLTVGGQSYEVDVAGGKSDAKVILPFHGLSTVRAEGKLVGVSVSDLAVNAGGSEKHGKALLGTEAKDGHVRVVSVELQ